MYLWCIFFLDSFECKICKNLNFMSNHMQNMIKIYQEFYCHLLLLMCKAAIAKQMRWISKVQHNSSRIPRVIQMACPMIFHDITTYLFIIKLITYEVLVRLSKARLKFLGFREVISAKFIACRKLCLLEGFWFSHV